MDSISEKSTGGKKRKEKEVSKMPQSSGGQVHPAAGVSGGAHPEAEHSYALDSEGSSGEPKLEQLLDSYCDIESDTPEKPLMKRMKDEPSLLELQNNIVVLLSRKINERADHLEALIRKNTVTIGALQKSVDFALEEVRDLRSDMKAVKEVVKINAHKITELEQKLNEAERYRRRWNLRLHSIPEKSEEDIKDTVINICGAVVPELKERFKTEVDTVHRLGRKEQGKNPRTTIIQFISRSTRDVLWRRAKTCEFLRSERLRFAEDLSALDAAARRLLWPRVRDAREKGRRAYFVGGKAFIDGVEVKPE